MITNILPLSTVCIIHSLQIMSWDLTGAFQMCCKADNHIVHQLHRDDLNSIKTCYAWASCTKS